MSKVTARVWGLDPEKIRVKEAFTEPHRFIQTNGLTKDLMIAENSITPNTNSGENMIQLLSFGAFIGVLCTLTGATFVFLITRIKQDRKEDKVNK